MATIFDYLDWRGDIGFDEVQINEVDALIFARMIYLHLENYITESLDTYITVEELHSRFAYESERFLLPLDKPLLKKLASTRRFKDIRICGLTSKFLSDIEEQFCAVCFEAPTFTFVAFRGTDNTLNGWKEDFNLAYMSQIPAQKDALDYVNTVARSKKNLILGGHSKGGNVAIYAGIFTNTNIVKIYNFDGPGFDDAVTQSHAYQARLDLIRTYIPESSIIGQILNHAESCHIVKSTARGPSSHDPFSWQIMGSSIVRGDKFSENSRFIVNTVEKWRVEMTPDQRRHVVDVIYDMLVDEPDDTLVEWKSKWYSNLKNTISEFKQLDLDSRDKLTDSLFQLIDSARSTFVDMTKKGED